MQATITFCLTQAAQRAQMMATGQPVALTQTTVEDIPNIWLGSHFCKISDVGEISFDLTKRVWISDQGDIGYSSWSLGSIVDGELDKQPATGLEALQIVTDAVSAKVSQCKTSYAGKQIEIAASQAKRAAEKSAVEDRRADAILADPEVRRSNRENCACAPGRTLYLPESHHPRYPEVVAELDRREAIAKAAESVREAEKLAAIDAFIAASGDLILIEQHAVKLLCRQTAVSLFARTVLDKYLPVEEPDSIVCGESKCPCQDLVRDCVPQKIYTAWRKLLPHTFPKESAVEFRQVRNCFRDAAMDCGDERFSEGNTAGPVEYHAIVTIPSGPFRFTRRIKLEAE
jgi:hypothetical protein